MAAGETYEEFVEKFKPKKTTDDCYTPDKVYDAVRDWVVSEYGISAADIVRPFYPGGDYRAQDYTGKVVVDNPPFSILAEIIDFYLDNEVPFFIFAPALTLFSYGTSIERGLCLVSCTANITYDNGANVKTSFLTNMDQAAVRTAVGLLDAIKEAQQAEDGAVIRYEYPPHVITGTRVGRIRPQRGDLKFNRGEIKFIRRLDAQKPHKKQIFGGWFLISDDAAARRVEAEKETEAWLYAKAMRRADGINERGEEAHEWKLSDAEKEIVKELGGNDGRI